MESTDEAVKAMKLSLTDEGQQRDAGIRELTEALNEERVAREDALAKQRRLSGEEGLRVEQQARKAREEEERRVQEKILEVMGAVNQERDLRQESIRQEKQRSLEAREQIVKEAQALQ